MIQCPQNNSFDLYAEKKIPEQTNKKKQTNKPKIANPKTWIALRIIYRRTVRQDTF